MDGLQKKTLQTSRSLNYTYYTSPTTEASNKHPVLLFLHGFPASAHSWQDVIPHLSTLPHRVIIPDVLGYADSDKPTDPNLYNPRLIAQDFADILSFESITRVILIGHDWGSAFAQRFYLWQRPLTAGLIILSVPYIPPLTQPFDLDAINNLTTQHFGYPRYEYFHFFTAPDSPAILDAHYTKFWQVMMGDVPDWEKKLFCVPNAMRNFMLSDENVPLIPAAEEPRWKDRFYKQFENGGFEAATAVYRMMTSGILYESEKSITPEEAVIKVPVLFIGTIGDVVNPPDAAEMPKQMGLLPDLKEVWMESGHWVTVEKPKEAAEYIKDFVTGRLT
jgi:soluble epoxide hydrolase / lipid-phosphate phosphatase